MSTAEPPPASAVAVVGAASPTASAAEAADAPLPTASGAASAAKVPKRKLDRKKKRKKMHKKFSGEERKAHQKRLARLAEEAEDTAADLGVDAAKYEADLRASQREKRRKRLRKALGEVESDVEDDGDLKPRSKKRARIADDEDPLTGRPYTVSLAIPGSIVANAQSEQLKTYLAGQIARAATIYRIDEIIVYSEDGQDLTTPGKAIPQRDPNGFLARMLQYLECPQYLRKHLFPIDSSLQHAGLANPLVAPHHVKRSDPSKFREGVILPRGDIKDGLIKERRPASELLKRKERSPFAHVGLRHAVELDKAFPCGTRVSVEMEDPAGAPTATTGPHKGRVVDPSEPRRAHGIYWGYQLRLATGLSGALRNCPFSKKGYDLVVGTSERGDNAQEAGFALRPFRRLLVVLGGVDGLEKAAAGDSNVTVSPDDVGTLFDRYINACVLQGSRTIRTEEAALVVMSVLHPHICANEAALKQK